MVGHDLRIRRFTPDAGKVLSLIPTDIGRPIGDLRPSIPLHDLERKIREVLETLSAKEEEIAEPDGRCHLVRIRPYRTEDHKIEGAVIALFDVTALKSSQRLEVNARLARDIVETAREPLLVLDGAFKVRFGNRSFYRAFRTTPAETETRSLFELGNGQWNIPRLRSRLEKVLPGKTAFQRLQGRPRFPGRRAQDDAAQRAPDRGEGAGAGDDPPRDRGGRRPCTGSERITGGRPEPR